MSHHIYETRAIILSTSPSGEADKSISLYTREFGLVRATAQGVRELKSKLRYSLQPGSLSVINLVRGRGGWRITNARLEENLFSALRSSHARLTVFARIQRLLVRMLQGEEKNVALFEELERGFSFLSKASELSLPEAELLLVLCVMHYLGYIGQSPALSMLLEKGFWGAEAIAEAARQRRALVRHVNESMRISQL